MRIVAAGVPAEFLRVRVRGRRAEPTPQRLRLLAFGALRRIARPLGDGSGVLTVDLEGALYEGSRISGNAFVWVEAGTAVNEAFCAQFEALARIEAARLKRAA
jgi:hypothetical protein